MTESISTPNALVQTQNGKRFYVNSGLVAVDDTETAVVDIANIGERDIKIKINPILVDQGNDEMTMKVKSNGIIIFQQTYDNTFNTTWHGIMKFIMPSNTSFQVTFDNSDATAHNVGVSCYGKYV